MPKMKRHSSLTDASVCVEQAQPAIKRLKIADDDHQDDSTITVQGQHPDVAPVLDAMSLMYKGMQYSMNAVLKQLHTERMQRLQQLSLQAAQEPTAPQ